jgi:death on curing protein
MSEPRWLDVELVLAIHDMQIAEHGGGAGVRDHGLLESALARPLNMAAYGDPDLCALAAGYAFGIACNHPFIDGNKRTALVACELFLDLNGVDLQADDATCVDAFIALAAGELSEEALTDWLRANSAAR